MRRFHVSFYYVSGDYHSRYFQSNLLGVLGIGAHLNGLVELSGASLGQVCHLDNAFRSRFNRGGRLFGMSAAAGGRGRDYYQRGVSGVYERELSGYRAAFFLYGTEVVLFLTGESYHGFGERDGCATY